MAKIKIVSNPYNREISYLSYEGKTGSWEDIRDTNPNSKLREEDFVESFLPFKIKDIVDVLIYNYYADNEKVEIYFQGTEDEYKEVEIVCNNEKVKDKIILIKSEEVLENARDILENIKGAFDKVQPVIKKIINDDEKVNKNLNKVSDALNDIIPICVFGNYSSGKSTFINSLIGSEVLPSGGDPVTAKIYKIKKSKYEDRAKINLRYKGKDVILFFEGNEFRVIEGDGRSEFLQELNILISQCEADMLKRVNCALSFINGFEKKQKSNELIGNVIELEVPFSKNGELGSSYNNFVIFDTPGSNSASNVEHSKVLEEALDGFSNGIPVWVSQYETMDTQDNANLCDRISEIEALDKRFTMIVLNKADGSDLGEEEFSKNEIKEILELNAIEKMYASGIYFVSSIMGLGAKNNGKLADKHYRKTYRSQQGLYLNPEDEDYVTLYKYNIMPEQIKDSVVEYSKGCSNLVYANSGLYCIEQEIEGFASKHSAYNKCKMVYIFLNDVISETNKRIKSETESLEKDVDRRNKELESTKKNLIEEMIEQYKKKEEEFDNSSKTYVKDYAKSKINYSISTEELEREDKEFRYNYLESNNLVEKQKMLEESLKNKKDDIKSHGQNFLKGNVIKSIKSIAKDYKEVQENKQDNDNIERDVDKATADKIISTVNERYNKNIKLANDNLSNTLKDYWYKNEEKLRNLLIKIITGSEALSESQREEILKTITRYKPLNLKDDGSNIFIKKKFLRGTILIFNITKSEKLNLKKLSKNYNDKIKRDINDMALEMNSNCFEVFKRWEGELVDNIEQTITDLNPELKEISAMIKRNKAQIKELEGDKETISYSLSYIKKLMSTRVDE